MAESASVESIESLVALRRAIFKFIDSANSAITDAESDLQRTLIWLEGEQSSYWRLQHRKRTEAVARAREAVRQKKIFKDATGSRSSAIDEEKILARAMTALEEAQDKIEAVRRYRGKLQKEIVNYKGQVQRFASTVQNDLKLATIDLDRMVQTLQGYVSLNVGDSAPDVMVSQSDAPTQASSALQTEPPKA